MFGDGWSNVTEGRRVQHTQTIHNYHNYRATAVSTNL